MIKVGGIQNTQVLWQAVFLAASHAPYSQLRRIGIFQIVTSDDIDHIRINFIFPFVVACANSQSDLEIKAVFY